MSPSALNPRTEVIEVVCSMSLAEMPEEVKALEEQITEKVQQSGRQFYTLCLCAFQQRWLQERRVDYTAVRWRTIDQADSFWSDPVAGAGGKRTGRDAGRLSHAKQSAAWAQSDTVAFAVGGKARVGSGYWVELSAGGS